MAADVSHLARALPPEERRDLRERIIRSLAMREHEEEPIFKSDIDQPQRIKLIRRDLERLSLWDRLRLWLRRLFTTKDEEQTFVEFRLGSLRRRVEQQYAMVNFTDGTVLPAFAEEVYELYRKILPVHRMLVPLWRDGTALEEVVADWLAAKVPKAKSSLSDFISTKDLLDLYRQTTSREAVKRDVLNRMSTYFEEVNPDIFAHLEKDLLPFYLLRDVVMFDYVALLLPFGCDVGAMDMEDVPNFRTTNLKPLVERLERLEYALYLAERAGPIEATLATIHVSQRLTVERLAATQSKSAEGAAKPDRSREKRVEALDEDTIGVAGVSPSISDPRNPESSPPMRGSDASVDDETLKRETSAFQGSLQGLDAAVRRARERLPTAEIIRVARSDPYYRFVAYVPKLRLRDFYYSSLKIRVLDDLDARFPEIRMGTIGKLVQALFGGTTEPFTAFRASRNAAMNRLSLPTFRYVRSLNAVYTFIVRIYRSAEQDLIRILGRLLQGRDRELQNDLMVHASAIEDVNDRIRAFDESFSPENDDGKTLMRLQSALERDPSGAKALRHYVLEKDRASREMIAYALEHFQGLAAVLSRVIKLNSTAVRDEFASAGGGGRREALERTLNEHIREIRSFIQLVSEYQKLEDED